jgi:hypothetical protein
MAKPTVIVVSLLGEAGSGKSTVANYLVKEFGFTRLSLAAPLKEIVRRAFELTEEQVYGDFEAKEKVDPRYNVSPRWLLQRIGTEGMREVFGKDVWIDFLCRTIFDDLDGGRYVIDDLRFVNEAERLFNLTNYVIGNASPAFHPDYVHSVIFKLAGVQQGATSYKGHASETEASQIPEKFIFETVTAEKSPGAQLLIDRFDAVFVRWAMTLPGALVEQLRRRKREDA